MDTSSVPNVEAVLQVLEAAAFRHDRAAQQVEAANQQLEQWQAQPGFYAALQAIGQNKSNPATTRVLALTQLKNGIDKHWRAGSAITPDEQHAIRSALQQINLDEADGRIVALTAVIFASIARRAFPTKWPTLFDDLTHMYHSVDRTKPYQFAFVLKIIQKTISEFQTLRLALPRKAYFDAAPKLLQVLAGDGTLQAILSSRKPPGHEASTEVFHAVLLFKCIRRMAVGAYECPHYDEALVSIWKASQRCVEVGMSSQSFDEQWWMAFMRQLVKFHLSMAQAHPITFALLEPRPLVHFYWSAALSLRERQLGRASEAADALEDGLAPYFILRTLMLLRATLKAAHNMVHTMKFAKSRDPDEPTRAKENLRNEVLKPEFVIKMFEGLIGSYMIYAAGDIEEWTDEAEEWEIREYDAEDAFEQSVRPCAERLFLDITLWYKDLVLDPLIQLARQYAPSNDVLVKDAVYSALGISASRIYEHFDFNQLFETQLLRDVSSNAANCNVLRRRLAILLAQWIPVLEALSVNNKATVYSVYSALLDPSDARNDQVVRVTAGKRFREIADDFGFMPDAFKPYASDIMRRIVDLMIEVQLPENKLALLDTLQSVIERMGTSVLQFADEIIGLLERLWGEVEKEQLMKKAIVGVLAKLTGSLKGASAPIQSFVIPLLRQVLNPMSPENLYLWEDSLDLLHEIVRQGNNPAESELIRVGLDYMQYLDRHDSQNLEKLMQILESLLVLAAEQIVQDAGARKALLNLICPLIVIKNTQVVAIATSCLELLICAAAGVAGEHGLLALAGDLNSTEFSKSSRECIVGCWQAHQSHGPNRRDPPGSARSETYIFVVLARVLLNSPQAFILILQAAAQERGAEMQGDMNRVLDEWFSHLDNVGNIAKTKLMVMALTRLLELQQPWIVNKLQDYMTAWTAMLVELRDGEEDRGGDMLVMLQYEPPQGQDADLISPDEDRRMKLSHNDPVHTVNLSHFIKSHVDTLVAQSGGLNKFQEEHLANVDKDVVQQFMNSL